MAKLVNFVERCIGRLPMRSAAKARLTFAVLPAMGYQWCGACCTTGRIGTECRGCGSQVVR